MERIAHTRALTYCKREVTCSQGTRICGNRMKENIECMYPIKCTVCRDRGEICSSERPSCKNCLRDRRLCLYMTTMRIQADVIMENGSEDGSATKHVHVETDSTDECTVSNVSRSAILPKRDDPSSCRPPAESQDADCNRQEQLTNEERESYQSEQYLCNSSDFQGLDTNSISNPEFQAFDSVFKIN